MKLCPNSYMKHTPHLWSEWIPKQGEGPIEWCNGEVDEEMLDQAVTEISRRKMHNPNNEKDT